MAHPEGTHTPPAICWQNDTLELLDQRQLPARERYLEITTLDDAIEAILAGGAPTPDDLLLLRLRKPQIDFDAARAGQRARIEAFLKEHPPTGGTT